MKSFVSSASTLETKMKVVRNVASHVVKVHFLCRSTQTIETLVCSFSFTRGKLFMQNVLSGFNLNI